ncbi:hypothetical protein [Streptomyces sp. ME19-01-6]|uniref:hypothetical protein n=1 Tax=Streptomyces sp. ME19-01-6 TaxID=3028686 RepID=UPI0029A523A6|nr:hypothetical protein [Streptomyces sp. ME19-01-6]MDX3225301.1 hypothetical protein [Streptomyces sp. ME19-01-6]
MSGSRTPSARSHSTIGPSLKPAAAVAPSAVIATDVRAAAHRQVHLEGRAGSVPGHPGHPAAEHLETYPWIAFPWLPGDAELDDALAE